MLLQTLFASLFLNTKKDNQKRKLKMVNLQIDTSAGGLLVLASIICTIRYGTSVSQMTTDMFHLLHTLSGPFLIQDLSPGLLPE